MMNAEIGAVNTDGVGFLRQFQGLLEHLALLANLVVAKTQKSECLHGVYLSTDCLMCQQLSGVGQVLI